MKLLSRVFAALLIAGSGSAQIAPDISDYPAVVTGMEPYPAGVVIAPGPYAPERDDANLVGERFAVGLTWYDIQANATLGKQITLDDEGGVHIVFMRSGQDHAGERHTFYNYVVDGEPQFDGGVAVDNLVRGGFCNISFDPDIGAIPIFHARADANMANPRVNIARDGGLGEGEFETQAVPTMNNGDFLWPKGCVGRNGVVHTVARIYIDGEFGNSPLQYVRSEFVDGEWEHSDPVQACTQKFLCYTMAASRVSDKIAIIYPGNTYPPGENARFNGANGIAGWNCNLHVIESEDGEEWDFNNPINATGFNRPNPELQQGNPLRQGDTLRAFYFMDGVYDNDDNLHVVFASTAYFEQIDPNANPGYDANRFNEQKVMIWHWDRESNECSMIASALYTPADGAVPGNYRLLLAWPSIGVAEDGTLYCVWTQHPQAGDRGANGFINGEIMASASVDNGRTWSVPLNLTETHAPNANAGDGRSECWSSLAGVVDDFLHISYLNDRDPASAVLGQGAITENQYIYHRVPRDDIPTEPRILGMDIHVGLPPEIAAGEAVVEAVAVPGGDVGIATLTLSNPAEESAGLWFVASVSQQLVGAVRVNPPAGRITAQGELEIDVLFSPEDEGVYEGDIIIRHNVPGANPLVVRFQGIGAAGFGELHGTVLELGNNTPVPGASLSLMPGNFETMSDEQGNYNWDELPALTYTMTVLHDDYLPFEVEYQVEVDGNMEYDPLLRFGTFEPFPGQVEISVAVDEEFDANVRISNQGNGPVSFGSELIFPGGGNAEPGMRRDYFTAGQIVGDSRLVAAAFVDDLIYAAGGNSGRGRGNIYTFTRDGDHVGTFAQFINSNFGIRDLAWDGRHLMGADGRTIYRFDTEGNLFDTLRSPVNPARCIAWDPDHERIWVCDFRSAIYGLNADGQVTDTIRVLDTTRFYGLGYNSEDPDGFTLYGISSTDTHPNQLYRIDPVTDRIIMDMALETPNANDRAGGFEITSEYDPYSLVAIEGIQGDIDGIAVYQIATRTGWVQLIPETGEVAPGRPLDLIVRLNTTGLPIESTFETTARFTHAGRGQVVEIPIELNVTAEGGLTQRSLALAFGWNTVSLNIDPETVNLRELLAPLVGEGSLLMVKDGQGNFYRPGNDFNNIDHWVSTEGYQFKMSTPSRLGVVGRGIGYDRAIPLARGWHIVSYLPRASVDVRTSLGSIADHLVVVKDGSGRFYLPSRDYSNMDLMAEGSGYHINVDADVELSYRIGGRAASSDWVHPTHFALPEPTDANMSVLIENVASGIEELAAVSSSGSIIGAGVRDANRRVGMAVWGGSPEEGTVLAAQESIRLLSWDGQSEQPVSIVWESGDGTYRIDDVSIGRMTDVSSLPTVFALHEPFPNPFNSTTRIQFDLPTGSDVQMRLFDASGRMVHELVTGHRNAGIHYATFDAANLPTGLYIIRIQAGHYKQSVKALLVR
jgi:hypothetical protein